MTLIEWLNQRLVDNEGTNLEKLSSLIEMNGGLNVRGWGITSGGGPYGKHGLDQGEALELIFLHGLITGFGLSENRVNDAQAAQMVKEEIDKKKTEYTLRLEGGAC